MYPAIRVLVVDDDDGMLHAIKQVLSKDDSIEIVTANNANAAIELLCTADAILADCIFPDAALFDDKVQQTGKPVLRMSGRVRRASNLQLAKPFTGRELRDAITMLRLFAGDHKKSA